MNKPLFYLAETRDDGQTFNPRPGIGYWEDENEAKAKAAKLTETMGELARFEVFTIYPYEND